MSEWISVDDRLPVVEETWSGEVLVCVGGKAVTVGWFEDYDGGTWHTDPGRLFDGDVTHWQPLPEPPND